MGAAGSARGDGAGGAGDVSIDPRNGRILAHLPVSTPADIEAAVRAAQEAATATSAAGPGRRAEWLEAVAAAVEAEVDELAGIADAETGLGPVRLSGEVARCANQLRFYATVAREGGWLGATIDHATDTTPDLRRTLRPLGPVAVFGASNFPFGFGTLGNDTGSALAAGCPVIVKGHPAHPRTHARLMELAAAALEAAGAPAGALGAVTGFDAGHALVAHPKVRAVAFTGSQSAGLALWRMAQARDVVIPVFAEMGTVNPVVVTSAAAVARAEEIATGCVASFTLGMGQFCTKPGLLLVPAGSDVPARLAAVLERESPRGPMLTGAIAAGYAEGIERLVRAGARVLASVTDPGDGTATAATLLTASAERVVPGSALLQECFGPVIIVVEYADRSERDRLLHDLQGALVGSVMSDGPQDIEVAELVEILAGMAGRVSVDAWPTGVATTWAQHHGGPWPATTDPSATSVGAAALLRFTRPVAYQGVPPAALPVELSDGQVSIPRRVDGRLQVPEAAR